jgi:hypothetical protein
MVREGEIILRRVPKPWRHPQPCQPCPFNFSPYFVTLYYFYNMTDQNIRTLFRSAESKRDAVETYRDNSSSTYRENLAAAIATFVDCRQFADRLSLFSPNETLEDIATGDLQYACLPMAQKE